MIKKGQRKVYYHYYYPLAYYKLLEELIFYKLLLYSLYFEKKFQQFVLIVNSTFLNFEKKSQI